MQQFLGQHIIYGHEDHFSIVFYNTSTPFMQKYKGAYVSVNTDDYSRTPKAWQPAGQAPHTTSDF